MNIAIRTIFSLFVGIGVLASPVVAQEIFRDDFESGNKATSMNGFRWTEAGRNVYITQDPVTGIATKPYQGRYSMGFTHRAKPLGEDSTAEQRFDLGGSYPEIWFSYWMRVPDNYNHRSGGGAGNTKWLALWTNNYEDRTGITTVWEYWPAGNGSSEIAYRWVGPEGPTAHQGNAPFINPQTDRGKWMHIVHRIRLSSAPGAADGVLQMWVKKQGASTYTQLHNRTNAVIRPAGGGNGFRAGYLMGWSNSGWDQETTFYLDDFKISRSSLLQDSGPVPSPPTSVQVQ